MANNDYKCEVLVNLEPDEIKMIETSEGVIETRAITAVRCNKTNVKFYVRNRTDLQQHVDKSYIAIYCDECALGIFKSVSTGYIDEITENEYKIRNVLDR